MSSTRAGDQGAGEVELYQRPQHLRVVGVRGRRGGGQHPAVLASSSVAGCHQQARRAAAASRTSFDGPGSRSRQFGLHGPPESVARERYARRGARRFVDPHRDLHPGRERTALPGAHSVRTERSPVGLGPCTDRAETRGAAFPRCPRGPRGTSRGTTRHPETPSRHQEAALAAPPDAPPGRGARRGRSWSGCRGGRAAAGRSRSTRRPPARASRRCGGGRGREGQATSPPALPPARDRGGERCLGRSSEPWGLVNTSRSSRPASICRCLCCAAARAGRARSGRAGRGRPSGSRSRRSWRRG